MKIQSTATVLFLLHAAIAVCFVAQCYFALAVMTAPLDASAEECAPSVERSGRSWSPFLVAFGAGGVVNVLGKGPSPTLQPANNWELARRDFLGKLHAASV